MPNPLLDFVCDLERGAKLFGAGDIQITFVDGDSLEQRRVFICDIHERPGIFAIEVEVRLDNNKLGALLQPLADGHPCRHS
ncbi:hypothetical protein D3C81_1638930 [compost metagenome]